MTLPDLISIAVYVVILFSVAWWASRTDRNQERSAKDYFLAGGSLPWWAIGSSLIAANISAEQIIGMSGSGFAIGLAIASYEWMAALTLLLVAKFLIPVFLNKGIYTMPEFLEKRFDSRVRLLMAVFWLGVYVFVNLTSVLWLGALAMHTVAGTDMFWGMLLLALFSLLYSTWGGLKAVAMTDVIQVTCLVGGGLLVLGLALDKIADGQGLLAGWSLLLERAPEKFDMILASDNPNYASLPGLSVLIGGMWIMNLSYWGFNQYITQRALAAKSLPEAQKGILFAAFLKLLMPLIVVLPGIAAFVLHPDLPKSDMAYPEMMKLVPPGLLGICFAALIAAIASSVSSMANSVATIFTMDIYRVRIRPKATDRELLVSGRLAAILSVVLAMLVAKPLLGELDQAFQYIQEFTGFFTPGVVVIFLTGMFWARTTANAALAATLLSVLASLVLKLAAPMLPFMDRVGLVFLLCLAAVIVISLLERRQPSDKAIALREINFATTTAFHIGSAGVVLVLVALYATWW
ncbi:sodium/solute symporter [Permianibacter sp. IMCC34836]|uniref:sodium:solute symporter family transporter n=1 Tax=Permianibacter fluminis TaxID=2738515 RepID=UPI00155228E7|nr:sodium/solute symporter [Permianibacter fluminis]NQD36434.1 sodium/solute symporter [Permianibacter fluminis]